MRTRWIAGIFVGSALALGTAASLAQRPIRPPTLSGDPAERKAWRGKAEPQDADPAPPSIDPPPLAREPSASIEPGQAADDPMAAVESFLRRSRKEADDSIQALTREAELLRARLAKVESALARWQSVAGSLKPGPKWGQPEAHAESGPELNPVEPASLPNGPAGPTAEKLPPTSEPVPPPPGVEAPPTLPNPSAPGPGLPAVPK